LFIVGFGEYAVVWFGTDWDKEIQKGVERNREQAKIRSLHRQDNEAGDQDML
jgi:multidrug resistance protein, MATE family